MSKKRPKTITLEKLLDIVEERRRAKHESKWTCPHDAAACDSHCQYWDGRDTCQTPETIKAMEAAGHWSDGLIHIGEAETVTTVTLNATIPGSAAVTGNEGEGQCE